MTGEQQPPQLTPAGKVAMAVLMLVFYLYKKLKEFIRKLWPVSSND